MVCTYGDYASRGLRPAGSPTRQIGPNGGANFIMTTEAMTVDRRRRHPQAHPLRGRDSTSTADCSTIGSSLPPMPATRRCCPGCADTDTVRAIGVESTGSFGATLTRSLTAAGDGSSRSTGATGVARRMDGKSDRLDAEQIARAVLGQTSTAIPEVQVRTGRGDPHPAGHPRSAVKARTQAFNTLWGV